MEGGTCFQVRGCRSLREGRGGNKDSLWWKDLREVWNLERWGQNFEEALDWKVGDGKEVLFWEDNWAGRRALKSVFPRLFSLSVSKASKVVELGNWNNNRWEWNFGWRMNVF